MLWLGSLLLRLGCRIGRHRWLLVNCEPLIDIWWTYEYICAHCHTTRKRVEVH